MDKSMADCHVETFPKPVVETSTVAPMCQRETAETEGGGEKTKAQHEWGEDQGRKDIPTLVLETSAIVLVRQRDTGETKCVRGEAEAQKGDEDNEVNDHNRRDSSTPVLETYVVTPMCQCETGETEGGGGKTKAHHEEEED